MQLGIQASLGATATAGTTETPILVTNTKSIILDGTDEYIDFGNIGLGATRAAFTKAIWYKTTDTTGMLWDYELGDGDNGFRVSSTDPVSIKCEHKFNTSGSEEVVVSNSSVNDGNWHHLASTFDGTSWIVYFDGVATNTSTTHSGNTVKMNYNSRIGARFVSGGSLYAGNVDNPAVWTSALSATGVKALYDNPSLDYTQNSVGYSSSSTLYAWWMMGDEADTRVLDTNANNLIVPDMRKTFFTGKSIDFDGSDDYISIPDSNDHTFGDGSSDSAFSVSAWINMNDATNFTILNKGVYNTDAEWNFRVNSSDKLIVALYDESVSDTHESLVSDSAITTHEGKWIHVAATYDGTGGTSANGGLTLYLNGSALASTVADAGTYVAMENLGGDVYIGKMSSNYADGNITDVAIWNVELNADTITSIYNSGEPNDLTLAASYTAGSGVDKTSNLKGYWRMGNSDSYSYPTVPDSSDESNNGTMTNMSAYDVVEHAPNRYSGDMIGFDATGDKTTDVPS